MNHRQGGLLPPDAPVAAALIHLGTAARALMGAFGAPTRLGTGESKSQQELAKTQGEALKVLKKIESKSGVARTI